MMKWCVAGGSSIGWAVLSLLLLGCGKATGGDHGAGGSGANAGGGAGGSTLTGSGGVPGGGVPNAGAGGGPTANAGTGALAGAEPNPNVYVAEIRNTKIDKVDLLFMIDNSISMADKQAVLADAVGSLLNRLVTPLCVVNGTPTGSVADASGSCAMGVAEFAPVRDLHVGVVSSSLGAHGGQTCSDPAGDDHGQLVSKVRSDPMYAFTSWNDSGFLFWDPAGKASPPGLSNIGQLQGSFRNMVLAVGQSGCGFESSLEGWYRFLIDPQPIISTPMVTDPSSAVSPVYNSNPSTNPVLAQRAQCLRPDSLVSIVMLSDENDCSIMDSGQAWLVGEQTLNGGTFRMPRSTSACAKNPNDKCCSSCLSAATTGCPIPYEDANCTAGTYYSTPEDALNLRCYKHKERFGFDLLYPLDRYVNGLSQREILDRDGKMVPNPLFVNPTGGPPRDASLVFLTGIVGVPWQDLAVDANAAALRYKRYDAIDWPLLLGTPGDANKPPTPPADKLMFETTVDRSVLFGTQAHPIIGISGALAPASATGQPNAINGHETNIKKGDDLQYACIFKLPQARANCTGPGCDCDADGVDYNRPQCEGNTQTSAKAYPGVRELQVLKDFGAKGTQNAIVGSICPKTLTGDKSDPAYGYNPVITALADRMKEALTTKCLPRKLPTDPSTEPQVPCAITESAPRASAQECIPCEAQGGRLTPSEGTRVNVLLQLKTIGRCGGAGQTPCEDLCLCDIQQYSGELQRTCQTSLTPDPGMIPGFCYVDPSQASDPEESAAESAVVANCPASQKRLIRFLGEGTPARGAITTIACSGAPAP